MANLELEAAVLATHGPTLIAGLDEAGRGALAGPVVAAAVVLPLDVPELLDSLAEVNDSKQLTAGKRTQLAAVIRDHALTYGVGSRPASFVDQQGIIAATKGAMLDALALLQPAAGYLLIDGRIRLQRATLPQQSVIRGDAASLSIAAASILAKVARDQVMVELDADYPIYGFARHKGYGTLEHRLKLEQFGPTPEHRLSFAPLRATLL